MNRFLKPIRTSWHNFKTKHPKRAKFVRFAAIILGTALGLFLLLLLWVMVTTPSTRQLRLVEHRAASEVYSADSVLLGRYFVEERNVINLEAIAPHVLQALVATEDERFFRHGGVDVRAWARVLYRTILQGDTGGGGGSTLSQQLAKNLFPRTSYGALSLPLNKLREIIIAIRLERTFTKEDILALYLNTVPFSENVYGIDVAARRFFSKSPSTLTVEEGATLIGSLKANSYYNPVKAPERARERRNIVLGQMLRNEYLTMAECDSLQALPLLTRYNPAVINRNIAPYFMNYVFDELEHLLKDHKKINGEPYDLNNDGLKVYTTLDVGLQQLATEAISEHMKEVQEAFLSHWGREYPWGEDTTLINQAIRRSNRYQQLKKKGASETAIATEFGKPIAMSVFAWDGDREVMLSPRDSVVYYLMMLRMGFLAVEPNTGYIRSWIGGNDYRFFQYDHVLARRQVGSVFKPVVYTQALRSGIAPCDMIPNRLLTYHQYEDCEWALKDPKREDPTPNLDEKGKDLDDWMPRNSDGRYGDSYSMQGALTNSVNTIAVHLIMQTGTDPVIELAQQMGIHSPLPTEPSIALGSGDVSLFEMVSVFGTLASSGHPLKPISVFKVVAPDGQVLVDRTADQARDSIFSDTLAHIMTRMLESVTTYGTAARLRYRYGLYNVPLAGKTGTSQNQSDGWFVGYTPYLIAGAWVGGETPLIRFRQFKLGEGAATALPICGKFFRKIQDDPEYEAWQAMRFPELPPDVERLLACPLRIPSQEEVVADSILKDSLFRDSLLRDIFSPRDSIPPN